MKVVALIPIVLLTTMACSDSGGVSNPEGNGPDVSTTGGTVNNSEASTGGGTGGAITALTGEGLIPDDLCLNDQPIGGILGASELVERGFINAVPVEYSSFTLGDSTTCALFQELASNGSDRVVPVTIEHTKDADGLQKRLDKINENNLVFSENGFSTTSFLSKSVGSLDVLVVGNTFVDGYIRFKQSNNLASTVKIQWIPQQSGNTDTQESKHNKMESLIDLIIGRGLSFEQSEPLPTDWFACDKDNLGVSGADPAALMSIIGASTTDITIDLDTDIVGARKCQAIVDTGPGKQNFFIEVSALDFSSSGIDPVQDFLNSDRDDGRMQITIGTRVAALVVRNVFFGPEGFVRAGPNNVTVGITVKVPEEFEAQLGDLVLAVATDIVNRIP